MVDAPPDLQISMDDIIKAGHCGTGARRWFRDHDLYDEFKIIVKGGSIPASVILATGDGQGEQVVTRTIERRG